MYPPDDSVIENYRQIKADRGCTWVELVDQLGIDDGDPRLASWMRQQAALEDPTSRSAAPRGRRGARAQQTTAAPPTEPLTPPGSTVEADGPAEVVVGEGSEVPAGVGGDY